MLFGIFVQIRVYSFSGLNGSGGEMNYYIHGQRDNVFCGIVEKGDCWIYVENGTTSFDRTGLIKGEVDGEDGLWYLTDSVVDFTYSGLTKRMWNTAISPQKRGCAY